MPPLPQGLTKVGKIATNHDNQSTDSLSLRERAGVRVMSRISRARQMRRQSTDTERALWAKLRDRRMMNCKFRRQFPIGRYIVDFVCHQYNLVIEIDGGHHAEQQDYDAVRTEWLKSQGFDVIRYWNNDVLTEMESVLESIGDALKKRGASYSPPPSPRGS